MRHLPTLAFTLTMLAAACATPAAATGPEPVVHVIRLQNTTSAELAATLRQVLAEDAGTTGTPQVVVAEHPDTNSLLISGDQAKVEQTLALIARLDAATGR